MPAFLSRRRLLLVLPLLLGMLPALANGATFLQLTNQPGIDRHPTWTPDGQFIIYESSAIGGDLNLWRVPSTGGVPVQLTALEFSERMPEVSPDGTKIAFTYEFPVGLNINQANIWTMPVGGGPATQISTAAALKDLDWHASWTPDGATIYFARRLGLNNLDWDLYKVPSTGGASTLVYAAPGIQNRPQVSNLGAQLIFENDFDGPNLNVVKSNIATPGTQTQLTFFTANTSSLDWSPNDSKILYSTRQNMNQFELWELDLNTLVHTQLTFDVGVQPFDPNNVDAVYSPDGNRIAFTSRRNTGNDNIWILDRNTAVSVVLSRFEALSTDDGVRLEWSAVEDSDHQQFNLYRGAAESGPWSVVNEAPIRGRGSYSFVDAAAVPGSRTHYELEAVDRFGDRQIVGHLAVDHRLSGQRLQLAGYPNPTRLGSNIRVFVPDVASVRLEVFDAAGRRVRVLDPGTTVDAGWHDYQWDGRTDGGLGVASGIYHVRAQTPNGFEQLRLVRTN